MKSTFILLIAFFSSFSALASFPPDSTSSVIEKGTAQYLITEGRRLYAEGQYQIALVKFREALDKDARNAVATYWLAECHLALGNYEKARDYAEQAIALKIDVYVESGYLLGKCYHRLGELDKAIENYNKALELATESRAKDLRIKFHIEECERAKEMIKTPINVRITAMSMNINSAFDDYAPLLSPDGKAFYFVSRRADNLGGGISSGDNRYFEDIYICFWDETSQSWGESSNSDETIKRLNSYGMDAINYISSDGKTLYLTINTMGLKSPKPKTKHSDIFISKINNKGGWNTPRPLDKPICTTFFEAAATFTEDGKTVYFVSERIGGEGAADIWTSTKDGQEWSKPTNMGKIINTIGQETTVFITPDGKYLFFSSTGHKGMGGYDVYVTTKTEGGWAEPMNLGYPLNTVSDETHFVYYPKLNKAFYSTFSSTANKGIGGRDLFEVDMTNVKLP